MDEYLFEGGERLVFLSSAQAQDTIIDDKDQPFFEKLMPLEVYLRTGPKNISEPTTEEKVVSEENMEKYKKIITSRGSRVEKTRKNKNNGSPQNCL